ncbi:uncharacterized protein LOC114579140 [Dendrobium catenatum]|uniref:uncharacterized protein LOC114579140 n=1 Tax=Dendrobium catenatum TaxID=906689 RepID=UPI00109FEF74|nr:uncharacterized protein LOC114579140 [Dendrobium catenatum]
MRNQLLKQEILEFQKREAAAGGLSQGDLLLLRSKVAKFNANLARITTWWRQRSKCQWMDEGEKNIRYYHTYASAKKKSNQRLQIAREDGSLVSNHEVIHNIMENFFKKKWCKRRCDLKNWPNFKNSDCIHGYTRKILEAEFTIEEFKLTLKNTGNNKSPGADGANAYFFKNYWSIVEQATWNAVNNFFKTGEMLEQWKETMGAFVPSRSISDNCLIAQELICKMRSSIANPGFPDRLILLILQCVSHPKFSVVINGKRTDWINAQCGFKQGCPLSPSLFIFCSDLLSNTLNEHKVQLGMRLASNTEKITHLLFADDVLVTAEAYSRNAKMLKKFFNYYCSWTGQAINSQKSMVLYGKAVSEKRRSKLNKIMGYKEVKELLYLGINLTLRRMKTEDYNSTIEKAMCRLNSWGARWLSLAGRILLIKTAYSSMINYQVAHSLIPKRVLLKVDKLCRNFLWHKENGKQGLHYIAWDTLCLPTSLGGFGIHGAVASKGPLRSRLAWMFLQNKNSLLLKSSSKRLEPKCGSKAQREEHLLLGELLKRALNRSLNGWPATCNTVVIDDKNVSFLMDEDGKCNSEKITEFFSEDMIKLIQQLEKGDNNIEDRMELVHTNTGKTISALCAEAVNFQSDSKYRKYNWLKNLKLDQKVYLFWWRALNGALPTKEWLRYRRLANSNDCLRGCHENEDTEHVIIKCSMLKVLLQRLRSCGFNVPAFQNMDDYTMALKEGADKGLVKIYALAVYHSWRSRKMVKHGKSEIPIPYAIAEIISHTSHIQPNPIEKTWNTNQVMLSKSWCPPPNGWIKLNVDAALSVNNMASIVGVLRDCKANLSKVSPHKMTRVPRQGSKRVSQSPPGSRGVLLFAVAAGLKRSFAVAAGLKKSFSIAACLNHLVRPGRKLGVIFVQVVIISSTRLSPRRNHQSPLQEAEIENLLQEIARLKLQLSRIERRSLQTDDDDEGILDDQISSTPPSIEFSFEEIEDPLSNSSSFPLYDEPVYDVYDDDMFGGVLDIDQLAYDDDEGKMDNLPEPNIQPELFIHNVPNKTTVTLTIIDKKLHIKISSVVWIVKLLSSPLDG